MPPRLMADTWDMTWNRGYEDGRKGTEAQQTGAMYLDGYNAGRIARIMQSR